MQSLLQLHSLIQLICELFGEGARISNLLCIGTFAFWKIGLLEDPTNLFGVLGPHEHTAIYLHNRTLASQELLHRGDFKGAHATSVVDRLPVVLVPFLLLKQCPHSCWYMEDHLRRKTTLVVLRFIWLDMRRFLARADFRQPTRQRLDFDHFVIGFEFLSFSLQSALSCIHLLGTIWQICWWIVFLFIADVCANRASFLLCKLWTRWWSAPTLPRWKAWRTVSWPLMLCWHLVFFLSWGWQVCCWCRVSCE